MRKMSAFLELPGEPAFREVQVILTGKRRAVNYVSAGRSKALRWRREISNGPRFCAGFC